MVTNNDKSSQHFPKKSIQMMINQNLFPTNHSKLRHARCGIFSLTKAKTSKIPMYFREDLIWKSYQVSKRTVPQTSTVYLLKVRKSQKEINCVVLKNTNDFLQMSKMGTLLYLNGVNQHNNITVPLLFYSKGWRLDGSLIDWRPYHKGRINHQNR